MAGHLIVKEVSIIAETTAFVIQALAVPAAWP